MVKPLILTLATLALAGCVACTQERNTPGPVTQQAIEDKQWEFESTPVWADEFNNNGLPDPTKWSYDVGGDGWGNQELQFYTEGRNARVSNGILTIEARRENMGANQYTSARMVTRGKGDWLYGRFEIRAKVPEGLGTWPAIWMLPTDWAYGNWPRSGEIDIMEHVGFDPNRIHVSIHTEAFNHTIRTEKTASRMVPGATSEFQVYRMDWTPYALRGYINNEKVFEFTNDGTGFRSWPFDKRFHLLLNIAVGGTWGGQRGVNANAFPTQMEVDYVRVYRMIDK